LRGAHVIVAVGVLGDLIDGLAGVMRENLVQALLEVEHVFDRRTHVGGGAASTTGDLMDHDVRVRQSVALALGASAEQHGAHAGHEADGVGADVAGEELHRVINRETCGDAAAGAVDVNVDVFLRVLHLEEQKLGDDDIGDVIVDGGAEENDAVLQQARVDVISALHTAFRFDDGRHDVVVLRDNGFGVVVEHGG
jgi:hypothetical protein